MFWLYPLLYPGRGGRVWHLYPEHVMQFMQALGHNSYNLKFSMHYDSSRIPVLDVEIYIQKEGSLMTNMYCKPSADTTLLLILGSHPATLVQNIPYAQYMRLCENCT